MKTPTTDYHRDVVHAHHLKVNEDYLKAEKDYEDNPCVDTLDRLFAAMDAYEDLFRVRPVPSFLQAEIT